MALYKAHKHTIKTFTGQMMRVTDLLIMNGRRPPSGWSVPFAINGIPHKTDPASFRSSMRSMYEALVKNDVDITYEDVGLTCNIHWVEQIAPKYQRVTKENLLALGEKFSVDFATLAQEGRRVYRSPQAWGRVYWDYLGHELAMDDWSYEEFLLSVGTVSNRLNPDKNPSRGCHECFAHFSIAVQEVMQRRLTQQEARQWLWNTHNSVNEKLNKMILSFEYVSKIYGWD